MIWNCLYGPLITQKNFVGVFERVDTQAHVLYDRKEDLLKELSLLKDVFICKGYPETLYVKWFSEGLRRKLRRLQVGLVPKTDAVFKSLQIKGNN